MLRDIGKVVKSGSSYLPDSRDPIGSDQRPFQAIHKFFETVNITEGVPIIVRDKENDLTRLDEVLRRGKETFTIR